MSDGILMCSPASAGATACWPATQGFVACLQSPWAKTMKQTIALKTPSGTIAAPRDPEPLALTLDDGAHCSLRTGGSFETRGEPPLYVFYTCTLGEGTPLNYYVWDVKEGGIDKSDDVWTVQVGGDGETPLVTRNVSEAFFVTN